MKSRPTIASFALTGILLLAATSARAATCPTVDVETPVERLARRTSSLPEADQIAAYRRAILVPHAPLYRSEVLGAFRPEALDKATLVSLQGARTGAARSTTLREVRQALAGAQRRFRSAFPDFRCAFPIYLRDSLRRLDGAGRQVAGRPALVLGIDQIEQERDVLPLPVFLAHELFHRYHSQVSGFSDDPGEHQAIWRALWAEGLATYISYRLTPGASVDEALITPRDLAARAQSQIGTISADLLVHLDQTDHDTYQTYFTYGDPRVTSRGLPWRTGYYVGFLVAQDLGRTRSLRELAALRGAPLEAEIRQALKRLTSR
jgi:uncharacterized protein YjaZ